MQKAPQEKDAKLSSIAGGDRQAFMLLYSSWFKDLFHIGVSWTANAELVKDAINQQFMKFWEYRDRLPVVSHERSYIITSFKNTLIRLLEKEKRSLPLDAMPVDFSPSDEWDMTDLADREELIALVTKAISMLPERQRELVFLRYYQGMTIQEITIHTGLTHRTVYNTIHSAISSLRSAMGAKHAGKLNRILSILAVTV